MNYAAYVAASVISKPDFSQGCCREVSTHNGALASPVLWVGVCLGLALLAGITYFPFIGLPFISDDYLQIYLARHYGAPAGWNALAQDPLYRCRATSLVASWLVDSVWGVSAVPYYLLSLGLHVINCLLVAALGLWKRVGWRVSLPAAAFFAVHEGHQEAVVWISALPELLVFLFGLSAFLCWVLWLQHEQRRRWLWLGAAAVFFALALLSKESAVAFWPLLVLAWWVDHRQNRAAVAALAVAAVWVAAYAALIFHSQSEHQHFHDGTFSWNAPFWFTIPHSILRMLWIWGVISLAVLWRYRRKARWAVVAIAFVWAAVGLAPYSFLTYMTRVPSRHTYLASVGLALMVGAAYLVLRENLVLRRPLAIAGFWFLVVGHNAGFLWIYKLPQYQRRAVPTERFVAFARETDRPIHVRCAPYSTVIYKYVAHVALNRPLDSVLLGGANLPPDAIPYCDDSTL